MCSALRFATLELCAISSDVLVLSALRLSMWHLHLQRIRWRHLAFPWFAAFRISIHVSTICMDDFAVRVLAQRKSVSACAIWGAGGFRAMSEKKRALSGPGEPGNFGPAGDPLLPPVSKKHVAEKLERGRLELEREDAQQQEFRRIVAQWENVAEELSSTMVYDKATDEFKSIDELSNDDEEEAEGKLRDEDDVVELTMPEPPQPASATLLAHSRPAPSKLPRPMPTLELKQIRDKLREAKTFFATAEAAQLDNGAVGSAAGSSGAAGSGQHGGSQHDDV